MMNSSSKFGISTRQSILAFIIMILLILVASSFSGQINSSKVNLPGGVGLVLAAPPGSTPTATPFQPILPTPFEPLEQSLIDTLPIATSEPQPAEANKVLSSIFSGLFSLTSPQDTPTAADTRKVYLPVLSRNEPPELVTITPTPTIVPTPVPEEPHPELEFTPKEASRTADEGKSWEDYLGPSVWPDIAVPAPVGILSHPEDQVNILLLGSDQREGDSGFRTDTILLLTINPSEGTAKLTSFPRDLYVYIPGYTVQRINTAFGWGGFEALAGTMEYNFGVNPEYYVLINFRSFMEVIDSIGGITVEVGRDLCDHRDDFGEFCVSQSDYWMDGQTALWYVRSRYTTSDLDRGRRQQEVLEATFNKMVSLYGLSQAPALYEIYKENVTTNMTFDFLARFLPVAAHLAETREISRYSIGADQVYNWINYSGSMVLMPMRDPVMEIMRQAVSEP